MTGILNWLGQEMQAGNNAPREECELRLESDEKAVRIITVHKSKGLEFDVVFCPYVWSDANARAAFHDPRENYRLTLDLSDNEEHKPLDGKGSARRSAAAFLCRGHPGQASLHDGLAREAEARQMRARLSSRAPHRATAAHSFVRRHRGRAASRRPTDDCCRRCAKKNRRR